MTVQDLLNDITKAAGTNGSQREVKFRAMFELAVHTSTDDFEKQVNVSFKECIVASNHPNQIEIIVC